MEIDNGDPSVFCDTVSAIAAGGAIGCCRGAGHNGPHAFLTHPRSPIVLAAESAPLTTPKNAPADKWNAQRRVNERELANRYARSTVTVLEHEGVDVPLSLCMKLVELFGDALATGASLERDYGPPERH